MCDALGGGILAAKFFYAFEIKRNVDFDSDISIHDIVMSEPYMSEAATTLVTFQCIAVADFGSDVKFSHMQFVADGIRSGRRMGDPARRGAGRPS